MDWKLPEMPEDATARERAIARRYTRVTPCACKDWPDAHRPWLTIGAQHFKISGAMETREEAEWICWMAAKAIMALLDSVERGDLLDGPKPIGEPAVGL